MGAPGPPGGGYANGYPTSPSGYGAASPSGYGATSDLTDRFGGMGVDNRGQGQGGYDRSSAYGAPGGGVVPGAGSARPRKYSVGEQDNRQDRRRSAYGGGTSPYTAPGPDLSAYPQAGGYQGPQSGAYPIAPTPQAGGIYASEPGYAGYTAAGAEPYRAPSPYGASAAAPYGPRAPSPYGAGGAGGGAYAAAQSRSRAPSPVGVYPRGPISRAASPVGGYIPRGAISRAASPVGGYVPRGAISRAPSPMMPGSAAYGVPSPSFPQPGIGGAGGYPSSPNMSSPAALAGSGGYGAREPEQLAAPPGFSRSPSAAQAYSPFDTIKIQEMDDFVSSHSIPKMPLVLQPVSYH